MFTTTAIASAAPSSGTTNCRQPYRRRGEDPQLEDQTRRVRQAARRLRGHEGAPQHDDQDRRREAEQPRERAVSDAEAPVAGGRDGAQLKQETHEVVGGSQPRHDATLDSTRRSGNANPSVVARSSVEPDRDTSLYYGASPCSTPRMASTRDCSAPPAKTGVADVTPRVITTLQVETCSYRKRDVVLSCRIHPAGLFYRRRSVSSDDAVRYTMGVSSRLPQSPNEPS